jgi:hypothetical protein
MKSSVTMAMMGTKCGSEKEGSHIHLPLFLEFKRKKGKKEVISTLHAFFFYI